MCFILWCNSDLNGPMGILLASVLGLARTMCCDSENRLDLIPVDICAKAMIIAAWKKDFIKR